MTKKQDIKSFLIDGRPRFQSMGCGFHKGRYYFGTRLWRDGRGYTSVITNRKDVYINRRIKIGNEWVGENEIKTRFGLNYKGDFYDEGLDFIFSKEAIDKFLHGDVSSITLKSVYDKLIPLIKKYMYFETETKYKVVALYRIAGFFMHVWNARARLFGYAEFGSAKSRLSMLLHNTGFNSMSLGDWTLAFLQRIIESTRGETHIDDYETLDDEKQRATMRLVKTGYMKGFKAGKTSDGTRRPEVFDLFNTTTLNNTIGLDFISNDRCITIRIPKIENKKYDSEPDFKQPIYKELRDELYILGLKEPERVAEIYPTIKSDKINGRLLSIIKPELTIAKLISEDLFTEVEEWWKEEITQRDYVEFSEDWEFRCFHKLYDMVVIHGNEEYISLWEEIIKPVIIEMYGSYEINSYKWKVSGKIGGVLSRSPIFKKRVVNGRTQYKVGKEDLISLLKAKKIYDPIKEYEPEKLKVEEEIVE